MNRPVDTPQAAPNDAPDAQVAVPLPLPAGGSGPEHDIAVLIRSQYPLVFLDSSEEERAERVVVEAARRCGHQLFVWSMTRGMLDIDGKCLDPKTKGIDEVLSAIEHGEPNSVYIMLDFAEHLKDDTVRRMLRDFTRLDRQTIVIVGHNVVPHESLRVHSAIYELPLPNVDDIERRITRIAARLTERSAVVDELDANERRQLARALRGLTIEEVDRVVSRLACEDGRLTHEDIATAVQHKSKLLARTGVLELVTPTHSLDDVAGFQGLKKWIRTRGSGFHEAALDLGLEPPRGFLLTGVPGCGKSHIVKALASHWNMPLLRLDAGALYDKYIGETERNLRTALATAEALAPSILWLDEIEKGFSTTGPSSSDGGLSYRLIGTLATWMQERKAEVFIAATSNDITALPPELTRKGRFDEIFFVDLPSVEERVQLIELQVKRRKQDPAMVDAHLLAECSEGFSGAELEQAVISALFSALADNAPLDTSYVEAEIEQTRPLSVVSAEKVAAIREWGLSHARLA